jgi:predicted Holliday junction resolvase-like endonuclease
MIEIVEIIVLVAIGFFLLFAIYVAIKRRGEIENLKKEMTRRDTIYKETIDKHTKEMKEYFETKTKLVSEFKVATDKIREEKDTMKAVYEKQLAELNATYLGELGHRKSSEVRLGRISESLAPFLNGWPWDPNEFRFLGNPIDGIQFNQDELVFVEIKTGKSRLSASQRWIKDLVSQGKVSFATFRISEDGSKLTFDLNNKKGETENE